MFDSPIFWIVAIWWLVSTLLGAKARKRRRAAQRLAEQELEPAEGEWQPEAPAGEPAHFSEEEPVEEFFQPPTPLPPRKQPATPLQEIFRALGMEETPPLFGGMTAEVEPEPPPPEPEPPKIVAEVPPPPAKPEPEPRPVREPSRAYLSIPVPGMKRLTPWQQAVVLKEILDTPPGLRSRTR